MTIRRIATWGLALLSFVMEVAGAQAEIDLPRAQLMAGPRMLPLPVQGAELSGKAPQGAGEPYRVLSGSEVLWEGAAGAEFKVKVQPGMQQLYLLSSRQRNLAWQDLAWHGSAPSRAKSAQAARRDYDARAEGVLPGKKDAGPALRRLLSKVRGEAAEGAKLGARISLAKGTYHFYPDGALTMSFFVSNHDQQELSPVGVPLVDMSDLEILGNGSTFVFHGQMHPLLLMDSKRIKLKDITISYSAPFYVEGEITEMKDGKTTLKFSSKFSWKVDQGRFRILREGGESGVNAALAFEKSGPMVPRKGGGDMGWTDQAEQVSANKVRFNVDAARRELKEGQVLVLRGYGRPHPAVMLYRARNVSLENVVFTDSQGMALLAQRSRDITIKGGGCITAKGRVYTASADATHFSNCAGRILTQNALYEGMMDDAINVHSTCLSIERVESPTEIIAKYMHRQAVGFEVFLPGEKVQYIKGVTLENHETLGEVARAEKIDATHLRLTMKEPLPSGIGEGDAVENADWYPSVVFRNNTVRYNRARGCLFTTPKSVLVEGNKFVRSHGSAILLAGDAQGWYESGRCLDVKIRNNLFDHNLTAGYQFTEAVISIYPEVRKLGEQKERYHQHILIENNTFRTHRVPLLYAQSAEDITWSNNKVIYDDLFPARRNGEPFILRDPKPTQISLPSHP